MAVLDNQITNASLKDITGALGVSLEEGAWISTAYLVAEIVVIPLTGWLSQVFSVRLYLLVNAALFICFSVFCAFATNLPQMILFRAGQGFTGGVLIPMAFLVILMTLPQALQPVGMALFGLSTIIAPSLSSIVGGWLTETYAWQYIFYLNVLPGLLLIAGVWYALPQRPTKLHLLKKGDWFGIVTMAIGLASLTFFLEEGNRKDWFVSEEIQKAALTTAISIPVFIIIQLVNKNPLLNLRLLLRRNFLITIITTMGLGLGLYGPTFILSLYLAQIQGYNAMQIGETIMWSGLPQLFITLLVPKLMRHIDLRLLLAVGFTLFGVSCFMNTTMTHDTGLEQLIPAQIIRALGQPLIITFQVATFGIEPNQIGSASAIYSMARNLGGSLGIATLLNLQSLRERFHSNYLVEKISLSNPITRDRIDQLTQIFLQHTSDPVQAQNQAYEVLDRTIRREANVMAFNDCFLFMGCALFTSAFLVLFLKKVKPAVNSPTNV
ncbi:EmrB/QacA family drug resistance transporter [Dulcicalothrix desertica PCC 7102]|uniref:EmrB/QacA family drug resistance transporter n=2 Tax=Dulcicalothrix desertica TaxID=32056 RepID=A0A3S1CM44_9CYAN|nr:EmrB/QacA family drug resistance transporter [Dulcicalothrix desertica PCC 7102]